MKQERKFRFVGDQSDYGHKAGLKKGAVYTGSHTCRPFNYSVMFFYETYPEDWEKVTEQEEEVQIHNRVIHSKTETTRIPNQDQPASSMTKFEMAVFMVLQGMVSDKYIASHLIPEKSISIVQETFKQLENLKK